MGLIEQAWGAVVLRQQPPLAWITALSDEGRWERAWNEHPYAAHLSSLAMYTYATPPKWLNLEAVRTAVHVGQELLSDTLYPLVTEIFVLHARDERNPEAWRAVRAALNDYKAARTKTEIELRVALAFAIGPAAYGADNDPRRVRGYHNAYYAHVFSNLYVVQAMLRGREGAEAAVADAFRAYVRCPTTAEIIAAALPQKGAP